MAYYTRFELKAILRPNGDEVIPHLGEWDSAKDALAEAVGRISGEIGRSIIQDCSGEGKWYDFEDEIAEASKGIPYIFTFFMEGEERDDLWWLDVYDGKTRRRDAVITYPEFDIAFARSLNP